MKRLLGALMMALLAVTPARAVMVQLPSQGFMLPSYPVNGPLIEDSSGQAIAVMSAAPQKIVVYGRVYQKDLAFRQGTARKNLSHISFASNNISCSSCTSVVQMDIEGVSTSAGPPAQPDGMILGGGGASATKSLSAIPGGSWITNFPNLGAPASVSYGQLIAVVFSFSSYNTGMFQLRGTSSTAPDNPGFGPDLATYNGTAWNVVNLTPPNIALEFSDGTVGSLAMAMPYLQSAVNDIFNSASKPSEIGMPFQLPFNAQIDQLCAAVTVTGAGSTAVLELTDSASHVLASVSLDGHSNRSAGGSQGLGCLPIPLQNIPRNTTYYVGLKATSAGNIVLPSMTVGAASSFDASWGAGQKFAYATRNGGAWSSITTTRRPFMAVIVSAVDDGTGPPAGSNLVGGATP